MSGFPCRAPWDGAVIHFSGAVYPCNNISQGPEMAQMRLGDLNASSLSDILRGDKARRLRQRLLDGNIEGLLCEHCDKAGTCNPYGDPSFGSEGKLIHGGAKLQEERPRLEPMPLRRLELGLTDLCNMNCIMCCLSWGEASPKEEPQKGMMSQAMLERLLDELTPEQASELVVWLHWIGEPLIYPHIDELCQRLDELGATIHLVTNGIQLKPKRQQHLLALKGRHTLNISLNAHSEAVFAAVNQSSAYAVVMRHTHQFLRAALPQSHWNIVLSAVVLRQNWQDVIQMVKHWTSEIRRCGGEPSIVINGKPDPNRRITAQQIALLREVALPSAVVYFRQVLRACVPDVQGWDLSLWEAFDKAVVEHNARRLVHAFDQLSEGPREAAKAVVVDLASESPAFAAELIMRGDGSWRPQVCAQLAQAHQCFPALAPQLELSALEPIDALHLAFCFPKLRQDVFGVLAEPKLWTAELRVRLADWLCFEPELDPQLVPMLECTSTQGDVLIAFWQGQSGLCIPVLDDKWLQACAALVSIHDRPNWDVGVTPQKSPSLYARVLEGIDAQNHPSCFTVEHQYAAPPWLWRAFRRRILFAAATSKDRFLKYKPPKTVLRLLDWEQWLLALCCGHPFDASILWRGAHLSSTAYSDLADVWAQLGLDLKQKKEIAEGLETIWNCPLRQLSAEAQFGLVRLWALCDANGGWTSVATPLKSEPLQAWQAEVLNQILE